MNTVHEMAVMDPEMPVQLTGLVGKDGSAHTSVTAVGGTAKVPLSTSVGVAEPIVGDTEVGKQAANERIINKRRVSCNIKHTMQCGRSVVRVAQCVS